MDDKELCDLACNPSINGYTPNPLYQAGYCPQYMKNQCYADGTMFERQWDTHQTNIKQYNAQRLFAKSFGQNPQIYSYSHDIPLPPTTDAVRQMYSEKKEVKPKKKNSTKKTKKSKNSRK